jgi:cytidylate kinase
MGNTVVTISRTYGSGGRGVGGKLAEELGFDFYDKQLVALVAEQSGLSLEFIEETGEFKTVVPEFLGEGTNVFSGRPTISDELVKFQNDVITDVADKGSCVIVGRSADYVLRGRKNVLNVFIHADSASATKRVIEEYGVAREQAQREIAKIDKARANHYEHYTLQKWGDCRNYDLSINTGVVGIDGAKDLIVLALKALA